MSVTTKDVEAFGKKTVIKSANDGMSYTLDIRRSSTIQDAFYMNVSKDGKIAMMYDELTAKQVMRLHNKVVKGEIDLL